MTRLPALALLGLLAIAACSSPRTPASPSSPPPVRLVASPPPVAPAPAPTSSPPVEPPLDPSRIAIRTRVARNQDCGGDLVDDYLRLSSKEPNKLVVRWLEQNMGDPFKARVTVRRGAIRLEVDAVDDPLGGLICGMQAYHLRTELVGLPAGSYRVIGPAQPSRQVGKLVVPTPRSRASVVVEGQPADPARPWPLKVASRTFDP